MNKVCYRETYLDWYIFVCSSDTDFGDERELSKAASGDNVCNFNSETPRAEDFPLKKWL